MQIPNAGRSYRTDIDGLRALAVSIVVVFHAFPKFIPGGFIGVDIFFVISGFLISGKIIESLILGNFSLKDFYKARIIRIFPALIITLIFVALVGRGLYLIDNFIAALRSIAAGAWFYANILFLNESGYFSAAAETKPLLHLWSLGIEEQFYFVWPFILILLVRNGVKSKLRLSISFLIFIVASFVWNIHWAKTDLTRDFYHPLSRFWEFLCGSFLALNFYYLREKVRIHQHWISVSGLLIILSAVWILNSSSVFPGFWAIVPVLGSCVLLLTPDSKINSKIFSNPAARWLGSISYPLYLWHWPLLVFGSTWYDHPLTTPQALIIIMCAVGLSWLTYRFIEYPIRFKKTWLYHHPYVIAGSVFIIGGAAFVLTSHPFMFPLTPRDEYVMYFSDSATTYYNSPQLVSDYRLECDFYDSINKIIRTSVPPSCYLPQDSRPSVFLWGNSHAQMLRLGIDVALGHQINLLQLATSGCLASLDDQFPDELGSCNNANRFAIGEIARVRPYMVVIAQNVAYNLDRVRSIVAFLKEAGVQEIVFIGAIPQWNKPLYQVIAKDYWPNPPQRISSNIIFRDNDNEMKAFATKNGSVNYISLRDALCDFTGCLAFTSKGKQNGILVFDYGHLTHEGSLYVGKNVIAPKLLQILPDSKE